MSSRIPQSKDILPSCYLDQILKYAQLAELQIHPLQHKALLQTETQKWHSACFACSFAYSGYATHSVGMGCRVHRALATLKRHLVIKSSERKREINACLKIASEALYLSSDFKCGADLEHVAQYYLHKQKSK